MNYLADIDHPIELTTDGRSRSYKCALYTSLPRNMFLYKGN